MNWNTKNEIKTQEAYDHLLEELNQGNQTKPYIAAEYFFQRQNGKIVRVDLNVPGKDCVVKNHGNPWLSAYHVTSKEDHGFTRQIATTLGMDQYDLSSYEKLDQIMKEYAKFWGHFEKAVNTDIYASVFQKLDPYYQIFVNQYQEILVCKRTGDVKKEIDYSVYDQKFQEIDNGTCEFDSKFQKSTVDVLCDQIDFRLDRCKKLQTSYAETLAFVFALESAS